MPGILPMKVIKVGTNSQSRIAQACDRCRSKKIRCDGVTPCCTQCKNVGFECKTSDKLSRRAFPRGYTESLEERVRALEGEVRELKELLDEKDEKIDLLSRIQAFSPRRASVSPPVSESATSPRVENRDDIFKVQQAPTLQKSEHRSDPFFAGASSARVFIDNVRSKIQEKGKAISNLDNNALISRCDLARPAKRADFSRNVSRLASDQLINVFFQEWSPLFPILHRPTFLNIYTDYVNDPETIKDPAHLAQLNLVFGIAALANESSKELLSYFEAQWQGAIGAIINETKLTTLQCLVLAQLYCIVRGDTNKLVYYTGVAVNMARRLGLHQSQKRFSLGALTRETRKKVFWSLYTLDAFGAVALGLPKLLKDEDVETEEPADVDDENVNERGFQQTLPGESTKLSSALALFRLARVLSKVQTTLYPAASDYELSMQKIGLLSAELDEWRNQLAPHLRLEFAQDKPSTNVISSRCPLLGLYYYYVRLLIHRPVIQSNLMSPPTSSVLAVAESGKHIIQILQLLQERSLSYTVCITKSTLILTCAFALMYQMVELPPDSKLNKDTQQFITACIDLLGRSGAPAVISFRKIVSLFTPTTDFVSTTRHGSSSGSISPKSSQELQKTTRGQLQAIAARFSLSSMRNSKARTQSTRSDEVPMKSGFVLNRLGSLVNNASTTTLPAGARDSLSSVASEPVLRYRTSTPAMNLNPVEWNGATNLDYLPLGTPGSAATPNDSIQSVVPGITDWDGLLSTFDPIDTTTCNPHLTGDVSPQFAVRNSSEASTYSPPVNLDWNLEWNNPEGWNLFDLTPQEQPGSTKSVLSFSDESTSGEDLSSCDMGSEFRGYSISNDDYYSLHQTATSPTSAKA